ncbi:fatty acid hydroxylase [Coprinopsis sp. MPI-PUGE-AT-0042]|nr:fatty acid hydroxylase [Coprinopsis sp. MPI-PUGE-AT-0042]
MDLVLDVADALVFDKMWAKLVPLSAGFASSPEVMKSLNASSTYLPLTELSSTWTQLVAALPRPPVSPSHIALVCLVTLNTQHYMPRQILSLFILTLIGIHVLYFLFAGLSYHFIFNKEMERHPRFLKNQIRMEIRSTLNALPWITVMTLPWFQGEVLGYSRLYDGLDTYGHLYLVASVPFFLLFTDYGIYWVHRWLHIPMFYKHIHKPHHKWIIPTPFASHAFHPIDGYLQSVPYHLFVFLFPLHRMVYLVLFVLVNFWSIFIHDSDMITGHALEKVINGPAHHTLHHLYFTVNYGQYFTWADRVGGSYRQPESSLDPLLEVPDKKSD